MHNRETDNATRVQAHQYILGLKKEVESLERELKIMKEINEPVPKKIIIKTGKEAHVQLTQLPPCEKSVNTSSLTRKCQVLREPVFSEMLDSVKNVLISTALGRREGGDSVLERIHNIF